MCGPPARPVSKRSTRCPARVIKDPARTSVRAMSRRPESSAPHTVHLLQLGGQLNETQSLKYCAVTRSVNSDDVMFGPKQDDVPSDLVRTVTDYKLFETLDTAYHIYLTSKSAFTLIPSTSSCRAIVLPNSSERLYRELRPFLHLSRA